MIVGFSIRTLNAERKSAGQGETGINYHSDITDVEEAEVPAFDDPLARISFELTITYTVDDEDAADIEFEGTVLWQKDADEVLAAWEEEDGLPEGVASTVTNHIFRKCLTQAVPIADALDLPSPVPMPRVAQQ